MRCPYCDTDKDKVIESTSTNESKAIRRRRECLACKKRFTTYERIDEQSIMVVKKDKRREPFRREKLLRGIIRSCEKRPVSVEQLEQFVSDIEKEIKDKMSKEITSEEIGKIIMSCLPALDQIAYVRFASVYREFKDVNEFINEIKQVSK